MTHRLRRTALLWLAATAFALAGCASSGLRTAAAPEEVGLSSQKLKELSAHFQAKVDAGEIPGAVLLVARDGKVAWYDAVGWQDREQKVPMRRDSLFRVASMTKPVTSLAVMMLVEEGKVKLDDPVSRFVPEMANAQVGNERPDTSGKPELAPEPARAPVTVVDLLRHTSGITYGVFGRPTLVKARYNAANLFPPQQTNAEFAAKLAKLPLQYQPATRWEYGMSTDLLGRVVEVASGMEFGQFVATRILQPLKMNDSGFTITDAEKLQRLAEPQVNPATGKRMDTWFVRQPPRWAAGGHGLVSTAQDYARFCQMLLNGGTLDGVRIVSPATVALMARDHLPPGARIPAGVVPAANIQAPSVDNGYGFGLGFSVRTDQGSKGIPGSIGDLTWSGAWGTYFWVDPKERLVAMFLTQSPGPQTDPWKLLMRQQVYGGLK